MIKLLATFVLVLSTRLACASPELEATYLALHITDWAQTRSFVRGNADHKYGYGTRSENNPFLPAHPSIAQVDRYFILTGVAHLWASQAIEDKYLVSILQYVSIAIEVRTVLANNRAGITIKF